MAEYINDRPLEALNYQTPREYAAQSFLRDKTLENIISNDVEFSTPFLIISIGLIYSWRVTLKQSSFIFQSNKAKISNLN